MFEEGLHAKQEIKQGVRDSMGKVRCHDILNTTVGDGLKLITSSWTNISLF
jgi:hypothetical protein